MIDMPVSTHITGAIAAMSSALMWAMSAILFRQVGESMSATAMNLIKGIVALVCVGLFLLFSQFADIDSRSYLFLALSGIVGICIGDTLYFLTLVRLGARLTLLLGSMIPVTTGMIAVMFLDERISGLAWLGVIMTIAGVAFVMWENTAEGEQVDRWRSGLLFGGLFVLANALGIIFTKVGVSQAPAMDATFVRTLWAVVGLTFWGLATRELVSWFMPVRHLRTLVVLLIASFIGAFLGTWLSVVALKYTYASVAAAFNSTSPLFVLPLSIWLLKERVSYRAIAGAVVSVAGIGLYFTVLD